MKVRMLITVTRWGAGSSEASELEAGHEFELEETLAQNLISSGHAESLEPAGASAQGEEVSEEPDEAETVTPRKRRGKAE